MARKSRKGIKQHSWVSLKEKDCFTRYHGGFKIHTFMHCVNCGRYHGITRGPRGGYVFWTWKEKEKPMQYGQNSGNNLPRCHSVPEQLALGF